MPVKLIYTKIPSGVIISYTGDITGKDIIGVNEAVADHPELVYHLSDFQAARKIDVSLPELHRIAIQDCSIPDHFKLKNNAIVGDPVRYQWLLDTYYIFTELWIGKRRQYETRTFSGIEEAQEWVGLVRTKEPAS